MFKFILSFCFISAFHLSFSQGCSDAGMCTLGGMKSGENHTEKYSIALNSQFGSGEQNISIFTPQLEFFARTKNNNGIQLKIPFVLTNGNLGSSSGIGDITIGYAHRFKEKKDKQFGLNIGFKIASGKTNIDYVNNSSMINPFNVISLPMPYQTGLGTNDLLLGGNLIYKQKWLFALGLQVPITQNNKNQFDTSFVRNNEDAYKYFSSSRLIRKPDLVIRVDRKFKLKENLSLNLGFIPIYHIGNDETENALGQKSEIKNSDGLTLNFSSSLSYKVSKNFEAHLRLATPLQVRKVRPDGLTRAYVAGIELKYLMW